MKEPTAFGDYIRSLRDKSNLGLREASRHLNISSSYLSRLEAGDYPPPSGEKLRRIAQLYNADLEKLMTLAAGRAHEMIAADKDVAPAVQQFYRLAQDQSPEMQEKMLKGAIDALDISQEVKEKLIDQLRAALSRNLGKDLPRRASGDDGIFAFDIAPRILSGVQIANLAKLVLKQVFGLEIPIPIPVETIVRKLGPEIVLIVDGDIEGGSLRDGGPAVLGLSRWSRDGRRRELVIHEELFEADGKSARRRANFTLGHELFHCLEHLPLVQRRTRETVLRRGGAFVSLAPELLSQPWFKRKGGPRRLHTREDWREWQANTFAAALLMPANLVATAFEELTGTPKLVVDADKVAESADAIARGNWIDDLDEETSLVDRFDVNPQAMAIRLMSLGLVTSE
jgi:transcriptional regulator with XRE-family HTH domain